MRKIAVSKIRDAVKELCLKANFELRPDIVAALKRALRREKNRRAKAILISILDNADLAKKMRLAICQDTGMVSVFLEIGRDAALIGGSLEKAVNEGVRQAYKEGCLRKSVVRDPLIRKNTNTNTPSVIHTDIVEGDRVRIAVSPKGFGSENKSRMMMFNPTDSICDIKKFIVDVVLNAGPSACPPFILGIGIGGTFEKAAYLAKKALLRRIDKPNPKKHLSALESEILKEINSLGMGPMGLGGNTTAVGVSILDFPVHIAGLPVAVNISCHATRSAEKVL
jgi:fumarate hydratase subunit alpha